MLGILLFIRNIETFQSVVILLEKGLLVQSKMLLRCMIDSTSALVCNANDEGFVKAFIDSHNYDELRNLVLAKELKVDLPGIDGDQEILKRQERIKSANIKPISSRKLIKESDLVHVCQIPFNILSESVHSTIADLKSSYFLWDNSINSHKLRYGPDNEQLHIVFDSLIAFIFVSLEYTLLLFDVPRDNLDNFQQSFMSVTL